MAIQDGATVQLKKGIVFGPTKTISSSKLRYDSLWYDCVKSRDWPELMFTTGTIRAYPVMDSYRLASGRESPPGKDWFRNLQSTNKGRIMLSCSHQTSSNSPVVSTLLIWACSNVCWSIGFLELTTCIWLPCFQATLSRVEISQGSFNQGSGKLFCGILRISDLLNVVVITCTRISGSIAV